MFWVRFRSSVILMVITLAVILLGGDALFAVVLAISIIGMTELYKTVNLQKSPIGFAGYGASILYFGLIRFGLGEYQPFLFIGFLLVLMLVYVFSYPKFRTEEVTIAFFGLFYVAVMLSYIYQVRIADNGSYLVWLIFIGAWGSDTCAYCVGMLFGKHKGFMKLSPKKSIEGCIGGVLGAALLGALYAIIVKNRLGNFENPWLTFALISGAASIISQLGDLAASAIKRNHDIKDYGTLIPGHGGILDRFDSIIFVAPIVYFLSVIV